MSYYQNQNQNTRSTHSGYQNQSQHQTYDKTLPQINRKRLEEYINYSQSNNTTRHDRSQDQTDYEDRQHNYSQRNDSSGQKEYYQGRQQQHQQQQHQNSYENHSSRANESYQAERNYGNTGLSNNSGYSNQSEGRPIQIIKLDPRSGKCMINKDALNEMMSYEGNIAFVSVAGKYRTGKSFLLNKLLNLKDRGFTVDPSTDACTQGIWMWSTPIYNEKENVHIFFLDTEGAQSVEKSATHDAKIFALSLLMSSYFIYNSVGAIDENSINDLSLTTQLSRNIAVSSEDNSQHTLSYYTPKFLWVLRDFTLQIQDSQGRPISTNQYLENALTDQSTRGKNSDNNRKIRQALLNYFKDRECMTFVRPADREDDLRKLSNLPNNRLRPDFLREIGVLKEKIMSKVTPKQLKGVNLNMRMYIAMVEKYVEAINQGSVPNISSAWDHLVENECRQAYEESVEDYETALKKLFLNEEKAKPLDELYNLLKNIRDNTLQKYGKMTAAIERNDVAGQYLDELKTFVDDKEKAVIEINEELNQGNNVDLLTKISESIRNNISKNLYGPKNIQDFHDDFKDLLISYDAESNGFSKTETLVNFLVEFQPGVIGSLMSTMDQRLQAALKEIEHLKAKNAENEGNLGKNLDVLREAAKNAAGEVERVKAEKSDLEKQKNKLNSKVNDMNELEEQLAKEKAKAEKLQRQLRAQEEKTQELNRNNEEMFRKLRKRKAACCQVS